MYCFPVKILLYKHNYVKMSGFDVLNNCCIQSWLGLIIANTYNSLLFSFILLEVNQCKSCVYSYYLLFFLSRQVHGENRFRSIENDDVWAISLIVQLLNFLHIDTVLMGSKHLTDWFHIIRRNVWYNTKSGYYLYVNKYHSLPSRNKMTQN